MPRVTDQAAAARREKVEALWLRGASTTGISRAVGCEWRTARRDLAFLGARAAREHDVGRELHRLLLAGQAVEVAAWGERQLGLVLGAQKAQLAILQVLLGLDVAQRVEALERRLDALTGAAGGLHGTSHGVALNGYPNGRGGVP